tara:strand:- start:11366 stop:12217 length:852 start_codon:yes stop_codon:yes gene_type:complete
MIKIISSFFIPFFLLGSASAAKNIPDQNFIVGSGTVGAQRAYHSGKIKVLLDANFNNLRIRKIRRVGEELAVGCESGRVVALELHGHIGPDVTYTIDTLLADEYLLRCKVKNRPFAIKVYISSTGGLLKDGYALGEIFNKYKVSVRIPSNSVCGSACAVAFLGGIYRLIGNNAYIMFHAPYSIRKGKDPLPRRFFPSDTEELSRETYEALFPGDYSQQQPRNGNTYLDCSDQGHLSGLQSYYKKYLGEKNGNYLFHRSMNYCSTSDGWVLDKDAAKIFGITTY